MGVNSFGLSMFEIASNIQIKAPKWLKDAIKRKRKKWETPKCAHCGGDLDTGSEDCCPEYMEIYKNG